MPTRDYFLPQPIKRPCIASHDATGRLQSVRPTARNPGAREPEGHTATPNSLRQEAIFGAAGFDRTLEQDAARTRAARAKTRQSLASVAVGAPQPAAPNAMARPGSLLPMLHRALRTPQLGPDQPSKRIAQINPIRMLQIRHGQHGFFAPARCQQFGTQAPRQRAAG